MDNIVKEISSSLKSVYVYKKILASSYVDITYLNLNDDNDFSRDIRCKYSINLTKDNHFTTIQIKTICLNMDYINSMIRDNIISSFPKDIASEIVDTYEYHFDLENKDIVITMEYRVFDRIAKDHNNYAIIKIIVDLLLNSAEELKE